MIIYVENPKDSTKKRTVLALINEFSKDTGQKINLQISVPLLHANSKLSEIEIKEVITFNNAIRKKNT